MEKPKALNEGESKVETVGTFPYHHLTRILQEIKAEHDEREAKQSDNQKPAA